MTIKQLFLKPIVLSDGSVHTITVADDAFSYYGEPLIVLIIDNEEYRFGVENPAYMEYFADWLYTDAEDFDNVCDLVDEAWWYATK